MSELKELVVIQKDLERRCNEIFDRDWKDRFMAAETKEEFRKIWSELRQEAGIGEELPGTIDVSVMLMWSKFHNQ